MCGECCRPKNPVLDDVGQQTVYFTDEQLTYLFPTICPDCRNEGLACTCMPDEDEKDEVPKL